MVEDKMERIVFGHMDVRSDTKTFEELMRALLFLIDNSDRKSKKTEYTQ
jgi:hypothetical protein